MGLKQVNYKDVREQMQPGDVIAFSGTGKVSEIIKFWTRSKVSHTAVLLQTKILVEKQYQNGFLNQIIESSANGVIISPLSHRIEYSDGEIWWLPLRRSIRKKMNFKKFYDFLLAQQGKAFDTHQAIKAGIDFLDRIPLFKSLTLNQEDFTKFFCSELVAAALEAGGAISHLNASEVTPIDLCMFNIFEDDYYQLKGSDLEIKGYNSINPDGWGE